MSDRDRFAEVVRADPPDLALACALLAAEVDPSLDVLAPGRALDALAAQVRPGDPVGGLRSVLGDFRGTASAYQDLRSSLLPDVLDRRTGLPILLAVVWVEVARRAGLQADAIGLPGHVVVSVVGRLVDAFDGGTELDRTDLKRLVGNATGGPLLPAHVQPMTEADLLLRMLNNIRVLHARPDPSLRSARTRLWAVELSLLLPSHPAALRQERGQLLVSLGRHLDGATELAAWADVVEPADPAAAATARRQAGQARARLS